MIVNESGQQLRLLRGQRKQEEVAHAVGVRQTAISMYENGRRVPDDRMKRALAAYYGVSVSQLFFNEVPENGTIEEKEECE